MKLTTHEFKELCERRAIAQRNPELVNIGSHGPRACAVDQELNVRHREERKPRVEKEMRQAFRVSIVLRFEDNRLRDIDAAVSTLFDTFVALRRFMERYSGTACDLSESAEWSGGSTHHD